MAAEQQQLGSPAEGDEPVDLKLDRPHVARMYDYYLGGKTHFPADRAAVDKIMPVMPQIMTSARANRAFMHRATRCLAADYGIRQFLDIGTGIPTSPNLHEVAQGVAPESRVVYVDNDPIVLVHARALLASAPEGRTAYIDADVRKPETILAAPRLAEVLDLTAPIALSLVALLHFIMDDEKPRDIVRYLVDALPAGSFLVMSHVTGDPDPQWVARCEQTYTNSGTPAKARSKEEFAAFFEGLDLIEPGIAMVSRWRPGTEEMVADIEAPLYGAVARKP